MFAWSFRRENASRRDAEKLRNPLELLDLPSVPKSAEPKILSPEDGARARCAHSDNAAMWLARARESAAQETAVFLHDYGERVREAAFTKIKNSAAARAGVSITRNAFRHTAVSALSRIYGHAAAADACGHDVRTQGVFYRAAMSEADARAWLSIKPTRGGS